MCVKNTIIVTKKYRVIYSLQSHHSGPHDVTHRLPGHDNSSHLSPLHRTVTCRGSLALLLFLSVVVVAVCRQGGWPPGSPRGVFSKVCHTSVGAGLRSRGVPHLARYSPQLHHSPIDHVSWCAEWVGDQRWSRGSSLQFWFPGSELQRHWCRSNAAHTVLVLLLGSPVRVGNGCCCCYTLLDVTSDVAALLAPLGLF